MALLPHLVCAPAEADAGWRIGQVWAWPGSELAKDAPLLELLDAEGGVSTLRAPWAGRVEELYAIPGEAVAASELLLLMLVDEPEFGVVPLPIDDGEQGYTVCGALLPAKAALPPPAVLSISPEAAQWALALGVEQGELLGSGPGGLIELVDVQLHVQRELAQLRRIRRVLQGG